VHKARNSQPVSTALNYMYYRCPEKGRKRAFSEKTAFLTTNLYRHRLLNLDSDVYFVYILKQLCPSQSSGIG